MARILLGPALADIRGKVGGGVFQRSAQGLTLRTLSSPKRTESSSQQTNRSQLFYLQLAWGALTDQQRNAWATWSSYQNLVTGLFVQAGQTGQQSFLQVNRYRMLTAQTVISNPVFTPYSQPQPTLSLSIPVASLLVTLTGMVSAAAYKPLITLSTSLPAARNAKPDLTRLMVPLSNVSATVWDVHVAYSLAFGSSPTVGNRLWWSLIIQQQDNGALSIVTSGTAIIT